MTFIQLVDAHSDRFDEIRALAAQYDENGDRGTVRRSIVTRDRQDERRFVVVVFFDSYESAMENSNRPETNEFAEKMAALVDGPPTFHDLDVVEDKEYPAD